MKYELYLALRHECRRFFGYLLSMIRLHRVDFVTMNAVDVVHKQRRFFAGWIIPLGNFYLKTTNGPVTVLPCNRWIEWEKAVDVSLRRDLVMPEQLAKVRDLWCRRVPGISLRNVLANRDN